MKLSKSQNSNNTKELDIFSKARESGLDISYTTINDGFPIEFDRVLHLEEYWDSLLEHFPARVDEFVGSIIESNPSMVHFLVVDTIFHWPAAIASKYKLVNVSFWTEPALVFSLAYHTEALRENGHFPCKDIVSSIDAEVLPTGFKDKVGDKGLIIPWCNQIKVLSNPAVGRFLTHCGWNSILESIWCSTPMICYPITYDQPTNKKLVVDDWKIGIGLFDGSTSINSGIQRDEVAKKIKTFMSTLEGYEQETKKVQAILQSAIEIDGSSERNLINL
ncbi:hypothetical protein RD792_005812 [Penstemon davidsonii]|uniref:Uncharacterized protein n=1 Tax=Penstemon davidsonii TaxID=160366 RepID=A0ABR0DFK4_9LAMI|nr:hypothetical protein RD792_005812 [Penstemon davidsonii]